MYQPDLFAAGSLAKPTERPARTRELDVPAILDRLTAACERPRYNFMVLNLIAQASARTGSAGPYVREGDRRIPIRDWLCDAMAPVARRDPRRLALADKIRAELIAAGQLPMHTDDAEAVVAEAVIQRIRKSGRTNVSLRYPSWFRSASSAATTKASASIITTEVLSAKRSTPSQRRPGAD